METNTQDYHGSTVERVWIDRLCEEEGLSRSEAERLASGLQATPGLVLGALSEAELEEQVHERIDDLDLEEHGIDEPEAVREDMKQALRAGIEGDLDGPVALVPESQQPTGPPDERNVPEDGVELTELVDDSQPEERDGPVVAETQTYDEPDTDVEVTGAGAGQGARGADGSAGAVRSREEDRQQTQDEPQKGHTGEPSREDGQSGSDDSGAQPQSSGGQTSAATDHGLDEAEEQLVGEELDSDGEAADTDPEDGRRSDDPSLETVATRMALEEQSERLEEELGRQFETLLPLFSEVAKRSVYHYRTIVQSAVFPRHSPAERQVLYEKLIEDPAISLVDIETDETE